MPISTRATPWRSMSWSRSGRSLTAASWRCWSERPFRAADFVETRQGVCRVLEPLSHELAETALDWRALMSARSPSASPRCWSRARARRSRRRSAAATAPLGRGRPAGPRPPALPRRAAACLYCGGAPAPGRRTCDACAPRGRADASRRVVVAAGLAGLAERRASGRAAGPHARGQPGTRAAGVCAARAQRSWDGPVPPMPETFRREILPGSSTLPCGRSRAPQASAHTYASLIRRGERVPHPRLWAVLAAGPTRERDLPDVRPPACRSARARLDSDRRDRWGTMHWRDRKRPTDAMAPGQPWLRGQALAGGRRPPQQHGRRRVQARRPGPDLPQVHQRRLRGQARRARGRARERRRPRGPRRVPRRQHLLGAQGGALVGPQGQRPAADDRHPRRRRDGRDRARQPLAQGRPAQGLRAARASTRRASASSSTSCPTSPSGAPADRAKDTLGRVYEYFLAQFASAEGKKGGQFYTPSHVVRVLVEMLAPYKGRVYDPCCGCGGMFVQSEKFIEAHAGRIGDISIYGQESNYTTWRLAKMNLAIRGIDAQIAHGDTFHNDRHPDLKADYVLANPPFNDSDWRGELLRDDRRWVYGVPPTGNANFAWVQHFISHLAPSGIAGFVLANGSMSSSQSGEGEIRKNIVEADLVDCMVALPGPALLLDPDPGVPLVPRPRQARRPLRDRRGETLFIDARQLGSSSTGPTGSSPTRRSPAIAGTYHAWRGDHGRRRYADEPGFCRSAHARRDPRPRPRPDAGPLRRGSRRRRGRRAVRGEDAPSDGDAPRADGRRPAARRAHRGEPAGARFRWVGGVETRLRDADRHLHSGFDLPFGGPRRAR